MARIRSRAKSISLFVVALLVWHFGGVWLLPYTRAAEMEKTAASARIAPVNQGLETNRFDFLLTQLKDVIKGAATKTNSASDSGFAEIGRLTMLKEGLARENEKIQAHFSMVATSLNQNNLPKEILKRHIQSVREYEAKYDSMMARLERIESAQNKTTGLWSRLTGGDKDVNWKDVLGDTLDFLEKNIPRSGKVRVDPHNLPHRSLKTDNPIQPKLTRDDWLKVFPQEAISLSPEAGSSLSGSARGLSVSTAIMSTAPEDLAETVEVKFTPEIRQLADSLEKNPVKIFNWVRNNIDFVPTWGSIQGAQLCLENRSGNAFDTSSLLIALLRYSGVPARYQMGTIEVPVEKFKNWAGGFTNTEAAASMFASAGVPSVVRRVNQTGQVASVKLEHVWVRAFVDHSPSGGAINRQGDAWLALDPSFKQHTFPIPADLSPFIRVGNPDAFLNQILATATVNHNTGEVANPNFALALTTLQPDEAAILDFVRTNYPQKSVSEIIGMGKVVPRDLRVLSAGLPYRVITAGTNFASVLPSLRHTLELSITEAAGSPVLIFARSLPELAGSRITFGYAPASDADRQALRALVPTDRRAPLGSLPATLINMVPEVRLNDQVVATSSASRLGTAQNMELRFKSPTVQIPSVVNAISVGEFFAIGLDLNQISQNSMAGLASRLGEIANEVRTHPVNPDFSPRELEDLLLNTVALGWFKEVDFVNLVAAQLSGVASVRYPSAALAFSDLVPSSLFGTVHSVRLAEITMDVDQDLIVALAKDGNSQRTVNYGLVTGTIGSMLEGSVPTQVTRGLLVPGKRSLATSSALGLAMIRGGTMVALNQNNFPLVSSRLHVPPDDLQDFQDALNAGLLVLVHERELVDLTGNKYLGYIKFDPTTGSGAYILGGTGGSRQFLTCDSALPAETDNTISDLVGGFVFEQAKSELLDRLGAAEFFDKVETLQNIINGIGENLERFNNATSAAPNLQLQPLMGLVVLFAALDILKELVLHFVPDVVGLDETVTTYLSILSGVAWRMAELFITRFLVIDAAIQGIHIPPDCSINLDPAN